MRQLPELQPPTGTAKTIAIYEEALYPCLDYFGLDSIVEDNASPHNNVTIRESHRDHGVKIVGYRVTPDQKEHIKGLIRDQCQHYRRDQDKKAQMTKQTRELDRLPAWSSNSPDLNLIEAGGVVLDGQVDVKTIIVTVGRGTQRPSNKESWRRGTRFHSSPSGV